MYELHEGKLRKLYNSSPVRRSTNGFWKILLILEREGKRERNYCENKSEKPAEEGAEWKSSKLRAYLPRKSDVLSAIAANVSAAPGGLAHFPHIFRHIFRVAVENQLCIWHVSHRPAVDGVECFEAQNSSASLGLGWGKYILIIKRGAIPKPQKLV